MAANMETIPAEYQSIVSDLIPLCAAAIDAVGGLCRMDVVCSNPAVRELRAKLPKQERGSRGQNRPKGGAPSDAFRMTKLLGAEEEFFTILDDNDKICTALAYEAGLVNSQKQITATGYAHLEEIKKQNRDENGVAERQPRQETRKAATKPKSGTTPAVKGKGKGTTQRTTGVQLSIQKSSDIRVVARKLYDAALNGTDNTFNDLVLEARKARKGRGIVPQKPIGRGSAMRPNANSGQTQRVGTKRAREVTKSAKKVESGSEEQMREVERLMRNCIQVLRKEPEKKMKLCHLADVDNVKSLKRVLNGVSFGRIFDTAYPQFFECEKDQKNQMFVTLVDEPPRGPVGQCPPVELPSPFKKRRIAEGEAQD